MKRNETKQNETTWFWQFYSKYPWSNEVLAIYFLINIQSLCFNDLQHKIAILKKIVVLTKTKLRSSI